jgi:hypothetical protein
MPANSQLETRNRVQDDMLRVRIAILHQSFAIHPWFESFYRRSRRSLSKNPILVPVDALQELRATARKKGYVGRLAATAVNRITTNPPDGESSHFTLENRTFAELIPDLVNAYTIYILVSDENV